MISAGPGTSFGQAWHLSIPLSATAPQSHIWRRRVSPSDALVHDSFARHTDDVGQLSSFGDTGHVLDLSFGKMIDPKVPEVEDLIVYELHVEEFNGTFDEIAERLSYLKSLGSRSFWDVVYQHVDPSVPYHLVYADAKIDSPLIGGNGPFGPEIEFSQEFARQYVQTANFHWLN